MKIAMIGAGALNWITRLLPDILSFPEFRESTISLMDNHEGRLDIAASYARTFIAQQAVPAVVEATTDRRAALDGADYVILTITVGLLEAERLDIDIPLKYGIAQGVGDTLGPGGVIRFLRTAPVLMELCRDMQELCPQALLLNYTNPMAMCCWLISAVSQIQTVGLCHSVQGTARQLAGYMQVPEDELTYWVAGINHMAWFLDLRYKGQDAYPLLNEAMGDPQVYAKDPVRFEVLRNFGYFVTESSSHMSEYVPYFRQTRESIENLSLRLTRNLEGRAERQVSYPAELGARIAAGEPLPSTPSHEFCAYIMHATQTNSPYRINGNVRNTGLITNLPADCCVEVPCMVDRMGVHPCYVGDLPSQLAALNRSNINVQELAVKAALEQDREAAFQAVALDPLTSSVLSLSEIRALVADLFAASSPWLPVA